MITLVRTMYIPPINDTGGSQSVVHVLTVEGATCVLPPEIRGLRGEPWGILGCGCKWGLVSGMTALRGAWFT